MIKRINPFLFFILLSITIMGQQKKSFTLNDLLPGGDSFYNLQPENIYTTWWGEQCIELSIDACYTIDTKNGKRKTLFTLAKLNGWLGLDGKEKGSIRSCYNLQFPYSDQPVVLISAPKEWTLVDFKKGKVIWTQLTPSGISHRDWNFISRNSAYIFKDNLYVKTADGREMAVSTDGSNDLVYGQSVHRDEFGISKGTFWSPKGNLLAFYRMDQSMVPDYPQMNIHTRIATTLPCKYPMAGETSHKVTIGVFNPSTEKTIWLQVGDPTDRYFTNITWSPNEENIYVIELNRDQNHAQLVCYNAQTGQKEGVLYEEKHPKYVEPMHGINFLPWDDNQFIYQSQRDGYNHLYLFDLKSKKEPSSNKLAQGGECIESVKVKQITNGNWVTMSFLGFNQKEKSIIIRSNELNPIQANLFSVNIETGKRTLLGSSDGVHQAVLSAQGYFLVDRYSSPTVTRSVNIIATKNGKTKNILTGKDPWKEYNVPEISNGSIKAADGTTDLYYRMVKPVDFNPEKKYPTVVYVYGGPHAHNVDASRNYLARGWEIYMAQKGFLIFVLDNRGSENRGSAFENVTFRQLGIEEMKDQMEGVKFLQSLPYVDASRMGVHGWSYGGFMTTNLMVTYPDVFKVGVAGGPVIDWKYYEVMYGERYMDTPQSNPEGYQNCSLLPKAKNLKGKLQLIIGNNDPVCVPQHSLSFIRACIDAGRQVDYFPYPDGEHNMFGRDQIHLHERITQYFEDYLK